MTNIGYISNNLRCTGCGACVSFCPKAAIAIRQTSIGRLFATINESECINCGLCEKICPNSDSNVAAQLTKQLNVSFGTTNTHPNVYIGHSTKEKIYQNSQSGGIVTQILFDLLSDGTIDAALCCQTKYSTDYAQNSYAVVITNPQDLFCTQKSFYSPISLLASAKSLNQYNSIAIVGLPCQIQAIRNLEECKLLKNIYITIGLICDRTMVHTCNNVIHTYVSSSLPKDSSLETKIIFKNKNLPSTPPSPNAYRYAPMTIEYRRNGESSTCKLDNQLRLYLKDFFTSPRCLVCLDKLNSQCDIACGDPWGMENVDWKLGDSLVISRTSKGTSVLRKIYKNNSATLIPSNSDAVYKGQKIDERINMAIASIKRLKEKGICIYPDYIMPLITGSTTPTVDMQKRTNKMINQFLMYEKHEKDFIIKHIVRKAKLHIMTHKLLSQIRLLIHRVV